MGALILVRQNRNRNGSGSRSNIRSRAVFRKESAWNYVVVEHFNSISILCSSFRDDVLKLLGGERGFQDLHSFWAWELAGAGRSRIPTFAYYDYEYLAIAKGAVTTKTENLFINTGNTSYSS